MYEPLPKSEGSVKDTVYFNLDRGSDRTELIFGVVLRCSLSCKLSCEESLCSDFSSFFPIRPETGTSVLC